MWSAPGFEPIAASFFFFFYRNDLCNVSKVLVFILLADNTFFFFFSLIKTLIISHSMRIVLQFSLQYENWIAFCESGKKKRNNGYLREFFEILFSFAASMQCSIYQVFQNPYLVLVSAIRNS